ncbi:hypothetical protein BVRB_029490 [Beta vulgaris subsp. vulgaris]|uniref:Uncharacterized protein n=1 Tax=Beta vulgaris subsp. vulgaris TaxID=3555 RepID=A0A0J8DSC6_BETVV|nr:hypothetical protein BVRB_029490 [Beta vulgaris subsp. vulgaris]
MMRSAFVAYPTMNASHHDYLFTEWQHNQLRLISGSRSSPIKVWDLNHELCFCEMIGDGIRSLCSDGDNIVFTAHDDRHVQLNDVRLGQHAVILDRYWYCCSESNCK